MPGVYATAKSCDPDKAMKLLLGILAVFVVAGSLVADYKWRQWINSRREQEGRSAGTPPERRS